MKSNTRIALSFIISLFLGMVISFSNRQDVLLSLQSGFIFAVIATMIVAMLSWGIDIAAKKGYSAWVGIFLVLILNVLGLLLLAILPEKVKMD